MPELLSSGTPHFLYTKTKKKFDGFYKKGMYFMFYCLVQKIKCIDIYQQQRQSSTGLSGELLLKTNLLKGIDSLKEIFMVDGPS